MSPKFSFEQRTRFIAESHGKLIDYVSYVDDDEEIDRPYWVITFTDGSEISVRLLAEDDDDE